MRWFKKLILATSLFLAALPAFGQPAQSVIQSGDVTPNHVVIWNTNGIVQDGGTANDTSLSSLGVTNATAAGFCISSGRLTDAGRQQLCFGAPLASNAVISLQNYGTATAQGLSFILNGTTLVLPSISGNPANGNYICATAVSGTLGPCSSAASTFTGNPTTSTATPVAFTIASLTLKGSPAGSDLVIISDQAASGAFKKATMSSFATASGISSINSLTGAITLAAGSNVTITPSGNTLTFAATVPSAIPPGTVLDYAGTSAPSGFLLADGSCVSQATYAALFAIISTNWGSCSAGNFALPDFRGRFSAGVDGGANRITNAGSGCTATLHAGCGAQNRTIAANNVPQLSVAITDPGHLHFPGGDAVTGPTANPNSEYNGNSGAAQYSGNNNVNMAAVSSAVTGITATANTASPNTATIVLNPVLIVNKIIKI